MPDRLSLHAPTLVNTIGHAAGVIIFGILLYLLLLDWRRNPLGKRLLPSVAAGLALLWNMGSIFGLATDQDTGFYADLIIALSFSVLSFLPAVLLQISAGEFKYLIASGYVLSTWAAVLHVLDLFTGAARLHYAAVLLITIGFGSLTIVIALRHAASGSKQASRRLVGAMALFLFAISFVHFGSNHYGRAWSGEIALHHGCIPLAMFVLLQDYRFLLLDTFIRFLVNASLAAAAVAVAVVIGIRFDPLLELKTKPFLAAIAFTGACVLLILFGSIRKSVQAFITRKLFLRSDTEEVKAQIQELAKTCPSEDALLQESAKRIGGFIGCDMFEWATNDVAPDKPWAELRITVTFARGDRLSFCLGARRGGRLFLSEDIAVLQSLIQEVGRQVDRVRAAELQALVMKGELQALQAQINPHFLFNTLNTIYGCIPRASHQARNLILNLSDILRYSLSKDAFIHIEDELRIVRAYLEIEQARLGARLQAEVSVDERAYGIEIPAFSVQPLVENAVKHGAASREGTGYVKLAVAAEGDCVRISIANSGSFAEKADSKGRGLALKNVRRRLEICYGEAARFRIESDMENTVVGFEVPVRRLAAAQV